MEEEKKLNKNNRIKIFVVSIIVVLFVLCFFFCGVLVKDILKLPLVMETTVTGNDVFTKDANKIEQINSDLNANFSYSNVRSDFSRYTDKDFANFRSLQSLGFKENVIYRSSSPIDNTYARATQALNALQQLQIHNIINVDNTEDEAKRMPCFPQSYYSQQNVLYAPLCMQDNGLLNLDCDENKTNIRKIFQFIAQADGLVLIHCKDGCDKTAFVCALLSSLTCSSYDYIKADYYQSNYCLRKLDDQQNTQQLRNQIDLKFRTLIGLPLGLSAQTVLSSNLNLYAKNYLQSCGVAEETVQKVYEKVANL